MDTKPSTNDRFKRVLSSILRISTIMMFALVNTGFSANVIKRPKADNWDGLFVHKPSVLRDKSGYKIWYDGADFAGDIQTGLANSKDGVNWKKAPQNPVLDGEPGAWDASSEHAPFVMKDGNLYKMWYEGSDGNVRQLGYATSHNGITWRKYPGNPVLKAGPESYDLYVAGHGTLLYEEGLYKLWYHAIGDQGAIIAYATSPDGIHWSKHGPVLVGAPESWDTALWGPSVLNINGTYWMWYSAAGPIYPISIGAATSSNGMEWTRIGDNPVITDPEYINNYGDPHVIFDEGLFKVWAGNFFSDSAIYYAESENGIDWSEPVPTLFPGTSNKKR
ncbi:MAG TPA: hypothetical protein VLA49_11830 [Anaerolineales bacterium]|nr:hypothetical protein [Anaerolineales bacterium]